MNVDYAKFPEEFGIRTISRELKVGAGDLTCEQAYDFLLEGAIRVPFCFINWV